MKRLFVFSNVLGVCCFRLAWTIRNKHSAAKFKQTASGLQISRVFPQLIGNASASVPIGKILRRFLSIFRWDDSNKWPNIGFGEEIGILEKEICTLSGALSFDCMNVVVSVRGVQLRCKQAEFWCSPNAKPWPWPTAPDNHVPATPATTGHEGAKYGKHTARNLAS